MTNVEGAAQLAVTGAEKISYQDAVAEGRRLNRQIGHSQMQLGELADKVKTDYGNATLKRFAAEIGITPCVLERYRSVFRKWKISAPGLELPSYSIARELVGHPDRANIVRNNPTLTRREAGALMRAFRATTTDNVVSVTPVTATEAESEDVSEDKQLGRMLVFANKVTGWAQDLREFRGELNATVVQAVRDAADALAQTADDFERRLRLQQEPERVH